MVLSPFQGLSFPRAHHCLGVRPMKTLKRILSEVLRIEETGITDGLTPQDVENWDSMTGLILVSALESNFQVRFTTAEVVSVKCVGDIKSALIAKGVESAYL